MMRAAHAGLALIGMIAGVERSAAANWSADVMPLAAPVTALRQAGGAVYIKPGSWLRADLCDHRELCFHPAEPPAVPRSSNGIPHGSVAIGSGLDVVRAWYSQPTGRYRHGVLGDRIEGGGLAAVDAAGRLHTISLERNVVFEDLTPRLADLDGDGSMEIVTIRSQLDRGAALAVYGLRDARLTEVAATDPIGTPNRWLNLAGITDFTGDGRLDIALVKTPHIGGRLEIWTLRSGSLVPVASAEGFSNHALGSTELGLSAIADADGDGVPDLALPGAERASLRIVSLRNGAVRPIASIAVGGRIATAIGVVGPPGRPIFLMGLEDGRAVAIGRN